MLYERWCGLDVHTASVVAGVLVSEPDRPPRTLVRTFGTMTDDLLTLADWLAEQRVTHVALERTGVYWQPIWKLLADQFTLLLVNPQHRKAVPGRKTDSKDAEWLADLLRHGLVRGSFVPDRPQRDLRDLTRYRTQRVRERTAAVNRVQKTLAGANIKRAAVASNGRGVSARAMLAALVAGEADAATLAQLATGRLREKRADRARALQGRFAAHQRFLVAEHRAPIDYLDGAIDRVRAELAERLAPCEPALERLDGSTGIGRRTAEGLLAELGTDRRRFPTAGHLTSWAGLCPGNRESAGKRQSGRTRQGNPWLRAVLVEAAPAAGRTTGTYRGAPYRRVAGRRGKKRAAVAVGQSSLVIIDHLLTEEQAYQDLGGQCFDERDRQRVARRLVRRLDALG